jgi:hypothetical protein
MMKLKKIVYDEHKRIAIVVVVGLVKQQLGLF